MKNKDGIIINKIINYICDIEKYVDDFEYSEFLNDKKTITACAFSVSQIGELVKELSSDLIEKYSDVPWHSIKGMRNRIVHDYEGINLNILWRTITESLPELKIKLNNIEDEIKL